MRGRIIDYKYLEGAPRAVEFRVDILENNPELRKFYLTENGIKAMKSFLESIEALPEGIVLSMAIADSNGRLVIA